MRLLILLLPSLLGFAALGIGYLAVGDSLWLFAFVAPPYIAGWVLAFGAAS